MKQKFRKLTFVRINEELPVYMRAYDRGFYAIIDGSYSQIYGGNDIENYMVYKLDYINGKQTIVNHIAWYPEEVIEKVHYQNRKEAEELIEEYNLRNAPRNDTITT